MSRTDEDNDRAAAFRLFRRRGKTALRNALGSELQALILASERGYESLPSFRGLPNQERDNPLVIRRHNEAS